MSAPPNDAESPFCRIRARTPVRINDIGGWTDTWFAGSGRVLNLAACPGTEVHIRVFPNPSRAPERVEIHALDFNSSFLMDPDEPDYCLHPLLQACVASLPVSPDIRLEIDLHSAVPPGISVGTSASVSVALLGGLNRLQSTPLEPLELASLAHRVETERLGWQSGIQDQICAALGGICYIEMPEYPRAVPERLQLPGPLHAELNHRTCLIYLGRSHRSSSLHEQVIASLQDQGPHSPVLGRLRELAREGRTCLLAEDLEGYGKVMIRNHECQRSLHPDLVPPEAEEVIALARAEGAVGWKVNGAGGGGGSLTILAAREHPRQDRMETAIRDLGGGIRPLPLVLCGNGLEIGLEGRMPPPFFA